jgi:DNA-binding CsgD family transcriptional regulator
VQGAVDDRRHHPLGVVLAERTLEHALAGARLTHDQAEATLLAVHAHDVEHLLAFRPRMRMEPEIELTPREQQVLGLLSEGRANKEIADALGCSVRTVEFHVSNLLRKVGASSRLELIARGRPAVPLVVSPDPDAPPIELRVFSGLGAAPIGDTLVYLWTTPVTLERWQWLISQAEQVLRRHPEGVLCLALVASTSLVLRQRKLVLPRTGLAMKPTSAPPTVLATRRTGDGIRARPLRLESEVLRCAREAVAAAQAGAEPARRVRVQEELRLRHDGGAAEFRGLRRERQPRTVASRPSSASFLRGATATGIADAASPVASGSGVIRLPRAARRAREAGIARTPREPVSSSPPGARKSRRSSPSSPSLDLD